MAQRLVRRLCPDCRVEHQPDELDVPPDFKLEPGETTWRGEGCRECRHTGYRGRIGIFELMTIGDDIREMIVQRKSAVQIAKFARTQGYKIMREDGWDKVRDGMTTVDEVVRVTHIGAM